MSNYLAIATVTATLSQLIYDALSAVSNEIKGAIVTTVRPDEAAHDSAQAKVNVYLYQITPNAALRNADLPTRRADGSLAQRPKIALDLSYLLTFYGDEPTLIPQRLLGVTVSTLQSEPMLTRERILSVTNPPPPPPGQHNPYDFLSTSTLAGDVELVKFSPIPLSLEELSKLWSVFLQTSYTLSVPYMATVVIIESEKTPVQALPVEKPALYVQPFAQPVIRQVILAETPAAGPQSGQPIVAGSTISLLGTNLRGDETIVRIGGEDITPRPENITDQQIDIQLPSDLPAGMQSALVIQHVLMGDPPVPAVPHIPQVTHIPHIPQVPHLGFVSNAMPFVLRPTISQPPQELNTVVDSNGLVSGDIQVQVDPIIRVKQQVTLLLIQQIEGSAGPSSYPLLVAPLSADSNTLTVPISGIKAGQYLVRIVVDGAESALANDQKNGLLTLPPMR